MGFKAMALMFKFRDFARPRKEIVAEIGLKEGFWVLDFGCGPGGYILSVAELVSSSGKIFALDINPAAIKMVQNLASKNHLTNVQTILSDGKTGLPDSSIDVAVMYDVFHDLSNPDGVLEEISRVLKPEGILSFSDHHLKETEITAKITGTGLFKLARKGEKTYTFTKT